MGQNLFHQSAGRIQWHRPHLETSLALIERAAGGPHASIIDVGGGESTLVDDLLTHRYRNLTVLDVSEAAIAVTRARLGGAGEHVHWIVGDITRVHLEQDAYDVWHELIHGSRMTRRKNEP